MKVTSNAVSGVMFKQNPEEGGNCNARQFNC